MTERYTSEANPITDLVCAPDREAYPQYDPEMILEHAVCHVLRHRRQLERW